ADEAIGREVGRDRDRDGLLRQHVVERGLRADGASEGERGQREQAQGFQERAVSHRRFSRGNLTGLLVCKLPADLGVFAAFRPTGDSAARSDDSGSGEAPGLRCAATFSMCSRISAIARSWSPRSSAATMAACSWHDRAASWFDWYRVAIKVVR